MWRFIRRLFILLVLFTVAFLVYRYVNSDGASRLVDKIKSVPDTISSYFGSDQDDDIKIDSTTVQISWDVNLLEDEQDIEDEQNMEDDTWLEELNKEIENILGKNDSEDLSDEKIDVQTTGTIVVEEPKPVIVPETVKPVVNDKIVTTPIVNSSKPVSSDDELSDYDYDQIDNVFGNLVE